MDTTFKYKEECVEFHNRDGLLLRGIVHHAASENTKGVTLICLNTGLNDMAGWHRIQVKTARVLAENGYDVLRYDDTGIGDSEGKLDHSSIVHIFSEIETGLFVENADAAVVFMRSRHPDSTLVYLGFCGGGLTGIHSAAVNKELSGVICIGGPVTLSSDDYLYKRDPWVVRQNINNYKDKVFTLRSWINILTFRGDYKLIFSSIFYYLRHKRKGEYEEPTEQNVLTDTVNLNKSLFHFFELLAKQRRPGLFFYAETDSATWEFKKYFLPKYQHTFFSEGNLCEFVEAENANHILSSRKSQQLLNKTILRWLENHFSN